MKNRRHVCNARDAGFIEYPGLPGRVKTGCMRSPQYKSRYCSEHQLHSCISDKYEEITDMESYEQGKIVKFMMCINIIHLTKPAGDAAPLTLHKSSCYGEPIMEILLQKKA